MTALNDTTAALRLSAKQAQEVSSAWEAVTGAADDVTEAASYSIVMVAKGDDASVVVRDIESALVELDVEISRLQAARDEISRIAGRLSDAMEDAESGDGEAVSS